MRHHTRSHNCHLKVSVVLNSTSSLQRSIGYVIRSLEEVFILVCHCRGTVEGLFWHCSLSQSGASGLQKGPREGWIFRDVFDLLQNISHISIWGLLGLPIEPIVLRMLLKAGFCVMRMPSWPRQDTPVLSRWLPCLSLLLEWVYSLGETPLHAEKTQTVREAAFRYNLKHWLVLHFLHTTCSSFILLHYGLTQFFSQEWNDCSSRAYRQRKQGNAHHDCPMILRFCPLQAK